MAVLKSTRSYERDPVDEVREQLIDELKSTRSYERDRSCTATTTPCITLKSTRSYERDRVGRAGAHERMSLNPPALTSGITLASR